MPELLVTVARFDSQPEAAVARSVLESHGIACVLLDEHTVRLAGQLAAVLGGIKLRVRESDFAAAREILAEDEPEEAMGSPEARALLEKQPPQCPECLSRDVTPDSRVPLFTALAWWVLGVHSHAGGRRWACRSCGNEWRTR